MSSSLAEQAAETLALVERRVSYMVAQSLRAIELLVSPDNPTGRDQPIGTQTTAIPAIEDLDRYAHHWISLVPDEPSLRAALVRQITERYGVDEASIPTICAALRYDDESVQAAYRQLSGEAPADGDRHCASGDRVPPHAAEDGDDAAWRALGSEFEWTFLAKSEVLFEQGTPSDCLYVLISGRLGVVVKSDDGSQQQVGEVTRGESVGEMGLLTGAPRSATVIATRDSELLRLSGAGFQRLAERYPHLMLGMARLVISRLERAIHQPRPAARVATIAVAPIGRETPTTSFARRLCAALEQYGPTLYLDRRAVDEHLREGVSAFPGGIESNRVVAWLNDQEARYRFLVLEADPTLSAWTRRAIRQADRVLLLADGTTAPETSEIEDRLLRADPNAASPRRDLVLLYPSRAARPRATHRQLAVHQVTAYHHVALDGDADLASLARRLAGRGVGLVLGSGGARGLAHIGVLRALREANVPIDVVGGTSAGAIVAALYAAGWDEQSMLTWGRRLAHRARQLADFTLPLVSFLAARRFNETLIRMFGEQQIEDLRRPYFCVSSNLTNAELVIHRDGSVWKAVRASCALPGVLPPVLDQGRLLADGVILDNLPIDRVTQLCDGGPVIAVDVSADVDLTDQFSFEPAISGLEVLWSRCRPFNRRRVQAPNILAVMTRAAELSSVRTRLNQARRASLYINPAVSQFGLFELKALDEMVERGYQAAREQLEPWLATHPF